MDASLYIKEYLNFHDFLLWRGTPQSYDGAGDHLIAFRKGHVVFIDSGTDNFSYPGVAQLENDVWRHGGHYLRAGSWLDISRYLLQLN